MTGRPKQQRSEDGQEPPMPERLMPVALLNKASLRGNEYAWRLADIPGVIAAARDSGLGCLGGQIQFRIPEGVCEMYWRFVDSPPCHSKELWGAYVDRAAEEVLAGVRALPSASELVAEGLCNFASLGKLHDAGVDVADFLCMVLYFEANTGEPSVGADSR